MTILIVEGSDLSGKTYAIERIAKHFNSGITIKNNFKPHNKDSPSQIYEQYDTILGLALKFVQHTGRLVILDRFFPSQAVYSFFRGTCELKDERLKALEQVSTLIDVKIIYLDTKLHILKERYDERGDEYISKENLAKIYNRYKTYLDACPLPILRLDTLKEGWMKDVEEFLK